MFRNLDIPRRLILSVGLPTALVMFVGEMEVKTDVRNRGTEDMTWVPAPLHQVPGFRPGAALAVTVLLFLIWTPPRRSAMDGKKDSSGASSE